MIDDIRLDLDTPQQLMELIRFSRLGVWAEKHGIPALKEYSSILLPTVTTNRDHDVKYGAHRPVALEALAMLPQEMKEKKDG